MYTKAIRRGSFPPKATQQLRTKTFACTAAMRRQTFKSAATSARLLFVLGVIGAMSSKQTMKFASVIDVTPFIVVAAMKWINVMIVEK